MLSSLFHNVLYGPLYNALIFLIGVVPFADVGIAIILLTLLVKVLLFPLSKKAVRTQFFMKQLEPELQEIKKKYAKDKQEQAKKTMELYREKKVNPFSSIAVLFLQLPVIFALYWVFFKGGLPNVDTALLYSFVMQPDIINMEFLGLFDMSGKSIIIALLAGGTQFIQMKYSQPTIQPRKENASIREDMARSMQLQMRYGLPVFVAVFAYIISAAVALYWLTSNIVTIGQELLIRKSIKKHE